MRTSFLQPSLAFGLLTSLSYLVGCVSESPTTFREALTDPEASPTPTSTSTPSTPRHNPSPNPTPTSSATPDPIATVLPTPTPSCQAPATSVRKDGSQIIVSFRSDYCAKVKVCVAPEFWSGLHETTYTPGIDLVILFDVTGSMTPYIKAMIANMQQMIKNLSTMTPDLRLGLATFRDFGDKSGARSDLPYMPLIPLTNDTAAVSAKLSTLNATGGGDTPESLATAVRAIADGKALGNYFGPSNMGFDSNPARIRVILGITDAMNRVKNLPSGAATLEDAANALKERGILFLGVGRKYQTTITRSVISSTGVITTTTIANTATDQTSFKDLAWLAKATGAIAKSPGIDLNGDDLITPETGEVATGEPAVLQMDSTGKLLGAPANSDPTKELADAIAAMVKVVKPFQMGLSINSGRSFTPASNTLVVPTEEKSTLCFAEVSLQAYSIQSASSCAYPMDAIFSADELTTTTRVPGEFLNATLSVDPWCGVPEPTPTPTPEPTPTPTQTPILDPTLDNYGGLLGV